MKTDPRCPKAAYAYRDRRTAEKALLDVKIRRGLKSGGRSSERSVYRCTICPSAWHLTSQR